VTFQTPVWLLALLLLPVAAGLELWLARRDRDRLARLVARPLWGRVVRQSKAGWRQVRLALALIGAAAVVVALARPQWGIVREKVEREGVDVVLVLDTSASMATPDVAPSRFFLARQALLQLVSRLEGDRFALVAFEGEAYPLVPLTLDADALGLFLETVEPGIVPAPGTSLGVGLAKGLDAFVDKERHNKVLVLVSDGEDLEGEVEAAIAQAKQRGIVVDTVGVGTEAGQPVPELDADGRVTGYKHDEQGQVVVSKLEMQNLEAIARGTGGQAFRITPQDTSLSRLAAAIEGMEQKTLAREYSYRRKEQFQIPLACGLVCLASALLLPLPRLRRRAAGTDTTVARAAVLALALVLTGSGARAQSLPASPQSLPANPQSPTASPGAPAASPAGPVSERGSVWDEVLLRPRRETAQGRSEYARGNHPEALAAFERAAGARPGDPALRFNVADGLYKKGRYDEAATLFRSLGGDPKAPLAMPSRFNLGNSLYQKQDYRGAIQAYRDALQLAAGDADTRRNLELALRALKEQEELQKREQQKDQKNQKKDQKQDQGQNRQQDQKNDRQQQDQKQQDRQGQQQKQQPKPQTAQERADERFRQETGMPQQRAMQLLDALQQNEKAEQKKLLALKRAQKRKGKDW
jgi:Ca-activated chloride channel family protein